MDYDPDRELFSRPTNVVRAGLFAPRRHGCAMKAIACSISLLLLCDVGNAAITDEPNEALPKQIKPVPGKVTLFADYTGKWPIGSIPVYLINASTNDLDLATQDGDVYLKLEVEDADGKWVRAQPHVSSFCGNSYHERRIRPGHFITIEGYQPDKGEKHKIRFSLYFQEIALSSNVGEGTGSARDIDLAWRDGGAVTGGSFEFVRKVALGEIQKDYLEDLQPVAIRLLGYSKKFDASASREVLLEVRKRFPKRKEDVGRAMWVLNARPVTEGSFEFVSKVALGEIQMDSTEDLQGLAIRVLGESEKFDPSASRQVLLEVLKRFPQRKYYVAQAIGVLNARAKSNGAGKPAR